MMWQPIETAPKDRFLLLCGPSGYTTTPLVFTTGRMCSDYHAGRWIDHANDDLSDWGFEPTHWAPLPEAPSAQAQPAKNAVAYLDLGTGGYMDIGTDLTDEELAALPKGRHMLGIIGTYGVDGYVPAQTAPNVPEDAPFIDTSQLEGVVSTDIVHSYPPPSGWLRAIDEALVITHLGVANASDTYEQAKAKLDSLIGIHVDMATDPAVNGGWKLVPLEPTSEMLCVGEAALVPTYTATPVSVPFDVYRAMLAAAPKPEVKP